MLLRARARRIERERLTSEREAAAPSLTKGEQEILNSISS
jgi:hypothetical protein